MRIVQKVTAALGSFWLSTLLLVLLMVLTLAGTFEQGRRPLHEVLDAYFESVYVVHYWGGRYPTPLPGGALLFGLLFVNLLVGAVLRARFRRSTIGIFVVHLGIVMLFVGGFVQRQLAVSGLMQLWEPRPAEDALHESDRFRSARNWEVAVIRQDEDGGQTEFVIPPDAFEDLRAGEVVRHRADEMPFDLLLRGYVKNAVPRPLPEERLDEGAEGYALEEVPPLDAERAKMDMNAPGLYATLEETESDETHDVLLWGKRARPFTLELKDRTWSVRLRQQSWQTPFRIELERFVHENHPGTQMPSRFSSYVRVLENPEEESAGRRVHITMNEPLRYGAYTLYQTKWGPQDVRMRRPDGRLYSIFQVVYNPTDHWLLGVSWTVWACVVIFLGMLWHYVLKLIRHQRERRAEAVALARSAP